VAQLYDDDDEEEEEEEGDFFWEAVRRPIAKPPRAAAAATKIAFWSRSRGMMGLRDTDKVGIEGEKGRTGDKRVSKCSEQDEQGKNN